MPHPLNLLPHIQAVLVLFQRACLRFIHDRCLQRASALAYANLLAIVPTVILAFSIFTSFQDFDHLAQRIQHHLVTYLVPTSQQIVLDYLANLSGKSTSLSIFGIIGLLITITALLTTMEEAFNDIWRIKKRRTHFSRFITFWALLTLSPLLLGASISITSYFAALPIIHDVTENTSVFQHIPFLIPWVISSLAMTALYISLPNTSVRFRSAAIAGIIAGALFEVSKLGFTFYVTELANYEKLYGTLGTLPIFLIWIYLTWLIVLLGAEINVCLQHPESSPDHKNHATSNQLFYFHHILYQAAKAFQTGSSIQASDIANDLGCHESDLSAYFQTLQEHHLLQETSKIPDPSSHWVLGMDAHHITWQMIHKLVYSQDIQTPKNTQLAWHLPLKNTYQQLVEQQNSQLAKIKLSDFIEKK